VELVKLEGDFENAVAKGGGKAFASWFADDAVTLNNGQPAVRGQRAIAAQATWDPKNYQLTWYAEGAQMGPSGDTGFTWGHYEAHGKDSKGAQVATSGRYITFWKKVGGHWKVALDASANDSPVLPQP
jgi:ketosteroid isomerase-like protein